MVFSFPDGGVVVESSAKIAAELPAQAFAITLSDSVIEDMILCVQNGGDIQLALGSNPKFLFDDHEIRIPKTSDPSGYDLFLANSDNPSIARKFPEPTMSILRQPKRKPKTIAPKAAKPAGKGEAVVKKAPARGSAKSSALAARPASSAAKDAESQKQEDATAKLKRTLDSLAADKRENSAVIVGGLPSAKGAKFGRLLDTHGGLSPRSLTPSPALSGVGSPSLLPSGSTPQERAKHQRFPLVHELAVQDLSREELLEKWDGTEEEFNAALDKVATFDKDLQKWVLKKNCWKDLDVFEYDYSDDDRRQKAIANAIKWYDRIRVSASDSLWQKLLPKADRGKGICLSNLQVTLAKGPVTQQSKQRADAASASGADSEKDESGTSAIKKGPGGEAMSRSSSQTSNGKKKLSASEAQAKRLLSTKKKPLPATTTKAAPKTSAAKSSSKGTSTKAGRVLSKEFVTDSDSSDDEVPLSSSKTKSTVTSAPAPKPAPRPAEKPRAPTENGKEKPKEALALKPKPTPAAKVLPRDQKNEKEKDTIRAEVIARPIKPVAKRQREEPDDDSSSSATPLKKRLKPAAKPLPTQTKPRTASDASQHSRTAAPKAKHASPVKSSPLASSPPTNASDVEQDRTTLPKARERDRERERERDREWRRETAVRGSSSSTTDTGSTGGSTAKKRPPTTTASAADSMPQSKPKRQRPSQETIEMAAQFRHFYAQYLQLHRDVVSHENPDPGKMTDLLNMHERLSRMKTEIYAAVEV
ncbi:hypothetical protein VTH06DRAFT_598 [Thermothelomyces fergusii]